MKLKISIPLSSSSTNPYTNTLRPSFENIKLLMTILPILFNQLFILPTPLISTFNF